MPKPHYTVGGTVQATGGVYIPRAADEDLLKLCVEGAFAYVLTSRQVGKSSLMVRTAEQLANSGVRSVIVDLTQFGVQVSAEAWYLGLLTTIADDLDLATDVVKWWRGQSDFGATQRLTQFFQEVVLKEIAEPIVIFIDEIDSTLSLNFTDDFYAAIRYLYNARAKAPEFRRLTFVLIGVATPSDLISDPHRTPFNIGKQVNLTDFTFEEAMPLAEGLCASEERSPRVLQLIMKWTNGHPYLTQRLCRTLADERRSDWTEAAIAQAVTQTFFGRMSEEDNNLQFVRDMLTKRAPDKLRVLEAYKEIRTGRRPVRDEEQSPIKAQLKLSGIVKREEGKLRVRNPIYHEVFGPAWIKEHWPVGWWQTVPMYVKVLTTAMFVLLISTIVGLAMYVQTLRDLSLREADLARTQKDAAEKAEQLATQSQQFAEQEKELRKDAEQKRQEAESEKSRAENLALNEAEARRREEQERVRAQREELVADSLRKVADERLSDVERRRRIDIARYLTTQADRQHQQGDSVLAKLLARHAYLFNQRYHGSLLPQIHSALMTALNGAGGPIILREHTGAVRAVAFSPRDQTLASAGDDATIRLSPAAKNYAASTELGKFGRSVRALAFSRDARALVSGSEDQRVAWWNLQETNARPVLLQSHHERVFAVALSPDAKLLASGGADSCVFVWKTDLLSVGHLAKLRHSGWVRALAFSSDSRWLATAGDESVIRVWQVGATSIDSVFGLKHESAIKTLAFHPQQNILYAGSANGKVAAWRLESNTEAPAQIKQMFAHEAEAAVNALCFSNDGRWLATGSSDKRVKLWEVASERNEPLLTFDYEAFVWSVAFNADASLLASAGADKTIRLWRTSTDTLAELVCENVKRNLTLEEWRNFIGADIPYERTCPNLPADSNAVNEAAKR